MRIWIDADAAPRDAKELIFRAADRLQIETILVANQPLQAPYGHRYVSSQLVPGGPDVADKHIVEHAVEGDLAVTADIPLAAALVERRVTVLDPRGVEHNEQNIGSRLVGRNLMDVLRQAGEVTGGPAPYGPKDRQSFAAALDRTLTRLARLAKTRPPA